MTEKEILKAIKHFQAIQPNKDYSKKSRLTLLSHIQPSRFGVRATLASLLNNGLSPKAPLQLASFIAVMALLIGGTYYATTQISPFFLPGLNQDRIVAEAEMIEQSISIELDKLDYFVYVAEQSNDMLNSVASSEFNHLNTTTIEKEAQQLEKVEALSDNELSGELNTLLEQLTQ